MEKINIAELLKDCPKGMELSCTLCNNVVTLEGVDKEGYYPIKVMTKSGYHHRLTCEGYVYEEEDAKCVIYPKGKTTWEGFHRPFKDGDIVFTMESINYETWISIFKGNNEIGIVTYADFRVDSNLFYQNSPTILCPNYDVITQRLATEEEKQKLFKAIKDNGYKWNAETKTLEQLIEPKFKVGDVIQDIDSYKVKITEVNIEDECYGYESMIAKGIGCIGFIEQDNWELVPNKFDITTLKPFDKVLVRDCNGDKWNIDFFACYRDNGTYQCMTFTKNQCIPYENNQHLLDTKNDCDEFYKTW